MLWQSKKFILVILALASVGAITVFAASGWRENNNKCESDVVFSAHCVSVDEKLPTTEEKRATTDKTKRSEKSKEETTVSEGGLTVYVDQKTQGQSKTAKKPVRVSSDKIWKPVGRFERDVFNQEELEVDEFQYGVGLNFQNQQEQLYMTSITPDVTLDPESSRPVIVALSGGATAGFCDSTYEYEQGVMMEYAQLGYATFTLKPLLDDEFCDGEPAESYAQNMHNNLQALEVALEYLNDNQLSLNIDMNRAAIYGYSIGGQVTYLKLRDIYSDGITVRALLGFASIAPASLLDFGTLKVAGINSPKLLMVSFEPDTGYGEDVDPDARQDCVHLESLGYDCRFAGLDYPAHPVHANANEPFVISEHNNITVKAYTMNYLLEVLAGDQ